MLPNTIASFQLSATDRPTLGQTAHSSTDLNAVQRLQRTPVDVVDHVVLLVVRESCSCSLAIIQE